MNLKNHVCVCKEECLLSSKQSNFSVYGSKTNYLINNTNKKSISKYIIDDCVLLNFADEEKCDYLFLVESAKENVDGYFIELKGADVSKAISQILNSIKHLKENVSGKIFGRIICSKFRKAPDIFSGNNYIKLRKVTESNIEIKSSKLIEKI